MTLRIGKHPAFGSNGELGYLLYTAILNSCTVFGLETTVLMSSIDCEVPFDVTHFNNYLDLSPHKVQMLNRISPSFCSSRNPPGLRISPPSSFCISDLWRAYPQSKCRCEHLSWAVRTVKLVIESTPLGHTVQTNVLGSLPTTEEFRHH